MKIRCVSKFLCGVCGIRDSLQIFYNNNGEIKYARARHYKGRQNGKPKFEYHQQSLTYIQRKLNEMPKETYPNITNKSGHIGQNTNIDLEKAKVSTILKNSWASSSVRIEHQPPKLGVEGSNPSPAIFGLLYTLGLLAFSENFVSAEVTDKLEARFN
jgi:hypothetical protein